MGKSKTKKTKNEPWAPAQPYILQNMAQQRDVFGRQQAVADQNAGILQSAIPGFAQKALGPDENLNAAKSYNLDVLRGKYLGQGNPYLQGMVDKARNDATNTAGARFGAIGGYGGSKYAEALGRGISDSELALRYGDYSKERDAMAQAASLTPGLINAQYAGIAPLLAMMQGQYDIATSPVSDQARNLAGLIGNYGTQTTKEKQSLGSSLGGLLGSGLSAWATGGFKI